MGTGSFPGVKYGRGVLLTTHPLLVPRSWKSRAIHLPTLWVTTGSVTGNLYVYLLIISQYTVQNMNSFSLSVKRNSENRFQRIPSLGTTIMVTCSVSFVVKWRMYEFQIFLFSATWNKNISPSFNFLLTAQLSLTSVNDQLDAQFFYFTIRSLQSSTCFEKIRAHHQEVKLH